ncbi:uncharacterized protein LOC132200481 [Neocloeon triangulifer]|uniref:uncharacterized protein LOC132200481 n=1 Tax=Neocloeon triangulifer TaxID=2078957 RepID=UPI00286EB836|nr:uncharacterized protein LOC132200481 [Neocloeon triangulifer]
MGWWGWGRRNWGGWGGWNQRTGSKKHKRDTIRRIKNGETRKAIADDLKFTPATISRWWNEYVAEQEAKGKVVTINKAGKGGSSAPAEDDTPPRRPRAPRKKSTGTPKSTPQVAEGQGSARKSSGDVAAEVCVPQKQFCAEKLEDIVDIHSDNEEFEKVNVN